MNFVIFSAAATTQAPDNSGGTAIALFVLVVAVGAWIALRAFVRGLRAQKTQIATGGDFAGYALEALVNAAKIDGRVNDAERQAIATAMREIGGEAFDVSKVEAAFANARLSKDELVAFLAARSGVFSRDQKVVLLKALMTVFIADAAFDETEHAALLDYTSAVGFDRQNAPDMLRGLAQDFKRGSIT